MSDGGPADEVLRCDDLVIGYRGMPLLPPLSLAVRRGRVMLVVGRNGAGKSTWLKTLLGLLPPVRGRIRAGTAGGKPQISYVPQQARLDELLPVRAAAVASWGQLRGWGFLRPLASAAEREARRQALARAGVDSFAAQPFRDLSGGQRQRVLFARLLMGPVDMALLDEPTASMDIASERQAYQRLAELAREQHMAVVVVTHTIGAAAAYADDVLFVDRGQGGDTGDGVVAFGSPAEVFEHPLFLHHFGNLRAHEQ